MKNLLRIFLFSTTLLLVDCSKDDADPQNKLVLPATIENNTGAIIPDAVAASSDCGSGTTPGTAESTLIIDKDGNILDAAKVSVVLNLSHPYGGDLVVQLFDPSGESCTLIKRLGATTDTSCGKSADFVSGNLLAFNSSAEAMIDPVLAAIPSGTYAPTSGDSAFPADAEMIAMADFLKDKKINGEWKLRIRDFGVGDQGTLVSWKLVFDTGALK